MCVRVCVCALSQTCTCAVCGICLCAHTWGGYTHRGELQVSSPFSRLFPFGTGSLTEPKVRFSQNDLQALEESACTRLQHWNSQPSKAFDQGAGDSSSHTPVRSFAFGQQGSLPFKGRNDLKGVPYFMSLLL